MITSLEIYNYLKDKFEENIADLEENELLTHPFNVIWFDKLAIERDLEKEQDYYNEVNEEKIILGVIKESEVIQDPAVPQSMYQLDTLLRFIMEEEYIDDSYTIMKNFIIKNKVSKHSFGSDSVMINIESGWDEERMVIKGKKMLIIEVKINMIVLASVVFSNDLSLIINGIEVTNAAVSLANETEMVPNLKKQVIMGMIPNTSIFQLSFVAFLDLTNPPLYSLLTHITSAQLFNQTLAVNLYLYKGTEQEINLTSGLTQGLFVKSVELEAQRGTVAVLKATLVTASII